LQGLQLGCVPMMKLRDLEVKICISRELFFFFGTGTLHPRMIGWGTEDEGSIDEGKRTVRSCDYEVRKGAFMRKEDGGG
jgi:hypothetical protein